MQITLADRWAVSGADLVQMAVVIVTVGAAFVAIRIGKADRRAAAESAAKERTYQRLRAELELAVRLLQNACRGGSTDPVERKQLGAEQMALVGALGHDRVPSLWDRRISVEDDDLRARLNDPGEDEHLKWKYESLLAVHAIQRDLDALDSSKP